MPRARYYQGPTPQFDNLTRALEAPGKKAMSGAEHERMVAVHEAAHCVVATLLGAKVVRATVDVWRGGGKTTLDVENMTQPDYCTLLMAGSAAERFCGWPGDDSGDLWDAKHKAGATDKQIDAARKRAGEMLRQCWSAVSAIADALQRRPLIDGATVRALIEAARKAPVAHRVEERICARREVMRFTRDGRRVRVGEIRQIANSWYAYRGNDCVGRFNDFVKAANAI
jgi:hypothetical protein